MKVLILFCITVIICNAQFNDYDNLNLKKCRLIIDEVIKRGEELDSLVEFLNDSSVTSTDRAIRSQNDIKTVIWYSKKLVKQIKDNKFKEGFTIEIRLLKEAGANYSFGNNVNIRENYYFTFDVKIRSNKTKDIIWFYFDNHDCGVWKLAQTSFCNNPEGQNPDVGEPCDKK